MGAPRPLADRFHEKVSRIPTARGCLLWTASTTGGGYGEIAIGRKTAQAHRVAWELANGPVPPGMHVLHRCDVRHCVAVPHLFLGSNHDNVKDRVTKGRNGPNPVAAANKAKTHCIRGHPLSGKNLKLDRRKGYRACRTCARAAARRRRARGK